MDAPFFFSNEFFGNDYIDNNLLIFILNENIFHIKKNIKKKKKYEYHISLALSS